MTWAVIKFTKENAVEAVPLSWFISNSQECFWPPKDHKREKIFRLIEQKASPLSDWKVYPAVILGSYDEFGLAQKKAKKAMVTTDLSSSSSDGFKGRGSRKRRKNSKYQYDTSSENSDAQNSSDDNIYPIYKKNTLESSPVFHENKKFRHSAVTSLIDESRECSIGTREINTLKGTEMQSSPVFHENKKFRHSAVTSLIDESRECSIGTRVINTLKGTEMQSISSLHAGCQSTSITDEESEESTPVILNSTEIEGVDLQRSTVSQQPRTLSGIKNSISNSWQTPKGSKYCSNTLGNESNISEVMNDQSRRSIYCSNTLGNESNISEVMNDQSRRSKYCSNTLGNESNISEVTNDRNKNVPNDEGFKKLVMDELSQINLKINTLIDNVACLIKTRSLESSVELHSLEKNVKTLYEKIPVKNENELMNMEQWLDEDKNKKVMVSELARIGGNSTGQKVRKIMYRTLTDEVAVSFSWDGAKSKKAFKNLQLARIILDAIKLQERESTENEIIDIIKYWLVKAKERLTRGERKKNQ